MHYDTTLKDLLGDGGDSALLRLVTGADAVRVDRTEYASTRARRPDFVAELGDGRLLHLELQAAIDGDMPWRMLDYYGLIAQTHGGRGVHQVVLALSDRVAAALPPGLDLPGLRLDYHIASFESLDADALLASDRVADNILAILGRTPDLHGVIHAILTRLVRLDSKAYQDAMAQLMVLAGARNAARQIWEQVTDMGIRFNLMENPVFRDAFVKAQTEGWEKGLNEGRAEGLNQGLNQGRAEGEARLILRRLGRRFGTVPDPVRRALDSADADWLDARADALLDAENLDQVQAILDRQDSPRADPERSEQIAERSDGEADTMD